MKYKMHEDDWGYHQSKNGTHGFFTPQDTRGESQLGLRHLFKVLVFCAPFLLEGFKYLSKRHAKTGYIFGGIARRLAQRFGWKASVVRTVWAVSILVSGPFSVLSYFLAWGVFIYMQKSRNGEEVSADPAVAADDKKLDAASLETSEQLILTSQD